MQSIHHSEGSSGRILALFGPETREAAPILARPPAGFPGMVGDALESWHAIWQRGSLVRDCHKARKLNVRKH
jgi:hypothetical protein